MITVKNLTYTYGDTSAGGRTVLRNVNLEIDKGQIVALIGHTGCGKSTLIQHFNAIIYPAVMPLIFILILKPLHIFGYICV